MQLLHSNLIENVPLSVEHQLTGDRGAAALELENKHFSRAYRIDCNHRFAPALELFDSFSL